LKVLINVYHVYSLLDRKTDIHFQYLTRSCLAICPKSRVLEWNMILKYRWIFVSQFSTCCHQSQSRLYYWMVSRSHLTM